MEQFVKSVRYGFTTTCKWSNTQVTKLLQVYKWNQPQTCEKCGDVLKSLGGLMDHMAAKHGSYEDREYKCDEEGCGKRFIRSSQLEQHKKSAHG